MNDDSGKMIQEAVTGRALVLMYHAVDTPRAEQERTYCVRPDRFREQMAWLKSERFNIIPLPELVELLKPGSGRVKPNTVVITFDDGLECFSRNALSVLRDLSVPATLFAVAGKIGGLNDWTGERQWPLRRLLNATELRELAANGVSIGCHGMQHRRLTVASTDELTDETLRAKTTLEDQLGQAVMHFAYPYGAQAEREREAVARAGFASACITVPGFAQVGADPYAIRRIDIYGDDNLLHFKRKVRFGANRMSHVEWVQYFGRRMISRMRH